MLTEQDKIKHLYNRAGFGYALSDIQSGRSLSTTIEKLFSNKTYRSLQTVTFTEVESAKEKMKSSPKDAAKEIKKLLKDNISDLNNLWFQEMIVSDAQLQEKMALFWHSHFACRSVNPYFDQQYLDIIRKHALGDFSTLLFEISKTPAMLQFLNNQQNKKDHPNENFAREVMELFTLGRGNYTETDIKEAARAFTGYGFDKVGSFKFKKQLHDFGVKTFQGKTGNFNGDDILKIILGNKNCSTFLVRKIYSFFVNEQVDEQIVQSLSAQFFQSNYNIKQLMKTIFSSSWIYDEKNIGNKIKSPIVLLTGMFRLVPTTFTKPENVLFLQRSLGQVLLFPPNVAGWKEGKTWIDSSSLLFRMQLPQIIYFDKSLDMEPKEEIPEMYAAMQKIKSDYMKSFIAKKISVASDWTAIISHFMLSKSVTNDAAYFVLQQPADAMTLKAVVANSDFSSKQNEIKSTIINMMSLPEYQLC